MTGKTRIYSSVMLAEVQMLQHALRDEGIESSLRNAQLSSLAGEVPFTEVMPELWVAESDRDTALALIARREAESAAAARSAPWTCPVCNETNEPQFGACWKCSSTHPSHDDRDAP